MSMNFRSLCLVLHLAARAGTCALPVLSALGAGAITAGCLFSSPGPSNVSRGMAYAPGDPTYDAFFVDLYDLQIALGPAPDREAAARRDLAAAVGAPAGSPPEPIGTALAKHAERLGKSGIKLGLKVENADGTDPKATFTASTMPTNVKDRALVETLERTTREVAALVAQLRGLRPKIEKLRARADGLEPGIDITFKKGGPRKRDEVRKNLIDAQRILPLMSQRIDEVGDAGAAFLRQIEDRLAMDFTPVPPPPPPESAEPADKAKPGGGKGASPKAGGGDTPKPAAPKPKPPADDFEP